MRPFAAQPCGDLYHESSTLFPAPAVAYPESTPPLDAIDKSLIVKYNTPE
jgi:hypothetical protein